MSLRVYLFLKCNGWILCFDFWSKVAWHLMIEQEPLAMLQLWINRLEVTMCSRDVHFQDSFFVASSHLQNHLFSGATKQNIWSLCWTVTLDEHFVRLFESLSVKIYVFRYFCEYYYRVFWYIQIQIPYKFSVILLPFIGHFHLLAIFYVVEPVHS